MALKEYPIKIDDTELPFWPKSWSDSEEPDENTMTSEGGTDLIEQVRSGKLKATISMKVSGTAWVAFFKQKERADSVQFSFYDVETGDYKTKTCRIRGLTKSLREDSEELDVDGIWDISFNILEF